MDSIRSETTSSAQPFTELSNGGKFMPHRGPGTPLIQYVNRRGACDRKEPSWEVSVDHDRFIIVEQEDSNFRVFKKRSITDWGSKVFLDCAFCVKSKHSCYMHILGPRENLHISYFPCDSMHKNGCRSMTKDEAKAFITVCANSRVGRRPGNARVITNVPASCNTDSKRRSSRVANRNVHYDESNDSDVTGNFCNKSSTTEKVANHVQVNSVGDEQNSLSILSMSIPDPKTGQNRDYNYVDGQYVCNFCSKKGKKVVLTFIDGGFHESLAHDFACGLPKKQTENFTSDYSIDGNNLKIQGSNYYLLPRGESCCCTCLAHDKITKARFKQHIELPNDHHPLCVPSVEQFGSVANVSEQHCSRFENTSPAIGQKRLPSDAFNFSSNCFDDVEPSNAKKSRLENSYAASTSKSDILNSPRKFSVVEPSMISRSLETSSTDQSSKTVNLEACINSSSKVDVSKSAHTHSGVIEPFNVQNLQPLVISTASQSSKVVTFSTTNKAGFGRTLMPPVFERIPLPKAPVFIRHPNRQVEPTITRPTLIPQASNFSQPDIRANSNGIRPSVTNVERPRTVNFRSMARSFQPSPARNLSNSQIWLPEVHGYISMNSNGVVQSSNHRIVSNSNINTGLTNNILHQTSQAGNSEVITPISILRSRTEPPGSKIIKSEPFVQSTEVRTPTSLTEDVQDSGAEEPLDSLLWTCKRNAGRSFNVLIRDSNARNMGWEFSLAASRQSTGFQAIYCRCCNLTVGKVNRNGTICYLRPNCDHRCLPVPFQVLNDKYEDILKGIKISEKWWRNKEIQYNFLRPKNMAR